MSKRRVFPDSDSQAGDFHIVSRVVERDMKFGPLELKVFRDMLGAIAAFCHVEVLTFCLMGNHFHLLVRVPPRPEGFDLPFDELWPLWEAAVGSVSADARHRQFAVCRRNGHHEFIDQWRQRMLARLFRLDEFVKALKQRFAQWYNRRHQRTGVFWEGRYRCVIVENAGAALRTMACYIDLNPVRAGIVGDPGDYRWSGYGEAMSGNAGALAALAEVAGEGPAGSCRAATGEPSASSEEARVRRRRELRGLVKYRAWLGQHGRERRGPGGELLRRGLREAVAERLRHASGVRSELLRRRVRALSCGVVVGSREGVEAWFQRHRWWMSGLSAHERQSGARRVGRGERHLGLHCLRQFDE